MGHFKYLIIGILTFAVSHYEAEAHRQESETLVKIDYSDKQSGISVPKTVKYKRSSNAAYFYPALQYYNIPRNYDYHHIDSYDQQQQNFPLVDQHNHNGVIIHPPSFIHHSYDQSHKTIFPHIDQYNHNGFVQYPPSFSQHGYVHQHHKFLHHEKENKDILESKHNCEKQIPSLEDHLKGSNSEMQMNKTKEVSVDIKSMENVTEVDISQTSNQSVISVEQNVMQTPIIEYHQEGNNNEFQVNATDQVNENVENKQNMTLIKANESTVHQDDGHHHNIYIVIDSHHHHHHHHPIQFSEHGYQYEHDHVHKHGYEKIHKLENWHEHGHGHEDKHDHYKFYY